MWTAVHVSVIAVSWWWTTVVAVYSTLLTLAIRTLVHVAVSLALAGPHILSYGQDRAGWHDPSPHHIQFLMADTDVRLEGHFSGPCRPAAPSPP